MPAHHIRRERHLGTVSGLLERHPVVAILGARQVGKTTLAADLAARREGDSTHFDLEDPEDLQLLEDPKLALNDLRGLVVIDEVQRRPDLFPVLRVLADRKGPPARFLILGSASPDFLRQSSETLAGRWTSSWSAAAAAWDSSSSAPPRRASPPRCTSRWRT